MILLDADVIAYRSAAACENESVTQACSTASSLVSDALLHCDYEDFYYDRWQLYLTGKNNYRMEIAKTVPYKGNRTAQKPQHLPSVRDYLVAEWGAVVVDGEEADDAIAIAASANLAGSVIVSVDKDFLQVPTHFYDFVKRQHHFITPLEGLKSFYRQMLTGDKADNIMGVRGIGKVKSAALIDECADELEMYDVVCRVYADNDMGHDRVIENGILLWLRRYEGQIWTPPTTKS